MDLWTIVAGCDERASWHTLTHRLGSLATSYPSFHHHFTCTIPSHRSMSEFDLGTVCSRCLASTSNPCSNPTEEGVLNPPERGACVHCLGAEPTLTYPPGTPGRNSTSSHRRSIELETGGDWRPLDSESTARKLFYVLLLIAGVPPVSFVMAWEAKLVTKRIPSLSNRSSTDLGHFIA